MLKITSQNSKNASQFLKKTFVCSELKASLRSACLLRGEFQTIIRTRLEIKFETKLNNINSSSA